MALYNLDAEAEGDAGRLKDLVGNISAAPAQDRSGCTLIIFKDSLYHPINNRSPIQK